MHSKMLFKMLKMHLPLTSVHTSIYHVAYEMPSTK